MLLLPRDFYALTWGQYNVRVRGWLRNQEERWEHTRLLYGILYNANVKEKDRKTPQQLIPLHKDRKNMLLKPPKVVQIPTADLIAQLKKRDNLT